MLDEFKFHRKPIVVFFHVLWLVGVILFGVSWAFSCFSTETGCTAFWTLTIIGWILIAVGIVGIGFFRRRYYLYEVIVISEEYDPVDPFQDPYYPAPAGYATAPCGYPAAPAGYPAGPTGYPAGPAGYAAAAGYPAPAGYAETPGDTTNPVDYPGVKIDP